MCAGHIHFGQVDLAEQDRFLLAGIGDGFFRRVGDKTLPPKLDAVPAGRGFVADTIDRGNAAAVCDCMTVLKRLRRRAGDRLGHGEVFVVLALAKILGGEQFLRADDLRPVFRRLFGLGQGGLEIFGGNAEAAAWIKPMVTGSLAAGIGCLTLTGPAHAKCSRRAHGVCRRCFRSPDRCGKRDSHE